MNSMRHSPQTLPSTIFLAYLASLVAFPLLAAANAPTQGELRGRFTCVNYGKLSNGTSATATVYSYKPGCEAGGYWCTDPQIRAAITFKRNGSDDESPERVTKDYWLGYEEVSIRRDESGHSFTIRVSTDPISFGDFPKPKEKPAPARTLMEGRVFYDPARLEESASGLQIPEFTPSGKWDCTFSATVLLPSAATDSKSGKILTAENYAGIGLALHRRSNFSLIAQLLEDLGEPELVSPVSEESIKDAPWENDLVQATRSALRRAKSRRGEIDFNGLLDLLRGILRAPLTSTAATSLLDYMAAAGYSYEVLRGLQTELRERPSSRHPIDKLMERYCSQAKILSPYVTCKAPL